MCLGAVLPPAPGAEASHCHWLAGAWAWRSGVTYPESGCPSWAPGTGRVATPVAKPRTYSAAPSAAACPQGHCSSDSASFVTQLHAQLLCGLPGLPTRAGWSCPCPRAIAATRTQMASSLGVLWALRQPRRHPVSPCQTQAPRARGLSRQAGVAREGDSPDSPGEGSREERVVEDRDVDGGGLQRWAGRASLGVTQRLLACFPGWGAQRGRVSPRLQ